ncbi:uncharacterized protein A4U43_C06F14710 [Asparagus officinalis]|uniref:Uncharacterized protein n=1 Tax=Asparagus officinalis TaxID=4686 RepID=A0A5P1ER28_ASPOF|nr:uncharacterized protein A4U43_C06F14710 [Asparagus officinalis]
MVEGVVHFLEELKRTDLRPKIQQAIGVAQMKKKIDDKDRGHSISEKKALIWSLQKQYRHARARLVAGELTPEEFDLEDATLHANV